MEGAGTGITDLLLGFLLVLLAGASLLLPQLFRAVMAFIAFGLVMALVWVRLDAVDIALAEAMIGSGITGALFLAALGRMSRAGEKGSNDPSTQAADASSGLLDPAWSENRSVIRWRSAPAAVIVSFATALLLFRVFPLPILNGRIPELVRQNLPESGVSNPVTAVLLNFRAYDTLLEIGVVLLALLGLAAVGSHFRPAHQPRLGGVLTGFYRLVLPLLILVSAYMVWVGKYEPGGAFQAAAVLAAGGIIGRMTGANPFSHGLRSTGRRIFFSAGFAVFLSLGAFCWIQSGWFLGFAPQSAGWFILAIELAATVSIALSLLFLFLGSSGHPIPPTKADRLPSRPEGAQ